MYVFGEFELDEVRFELRRDGEPVHVEPQVFDLLLYLVRNHDRVVAKDEVLEAVWGDRFVSDAAVSTRIKAARRAIGDDGSGQTLIRTVRQRGYQFVGEVSSVPEGAAADLPLHQDIRFCRSHDGIRIAYASIGDGPPLVKAANWMTHLGHDLSSLVWSHWLAMLSDNHRLVRYDERGCGLSTWDVPAFGFDDWVQDLELVVDAAGLDTFPLFGISQGAAVAVEYAVRHPERVERLVLVGGYAVGRAVRASNAEERQAAQLDLDLARVGWGSEEPAFRRVFAMQFFPDGTPELWDAFDELQRSTTSPDNAVRFLQAFAQVDVRDRARLVSCPTLVLHSRDDHRVPLSCAEELAALIPRARLQTLPSANHLLTRQEAAWSVLVDELTEFLDRS